MTFSDLTKKYGVKCEEFLEDFPVRIEGDPPSLISFLAYLTSKKFQEDQDAIISDFESALFIEERVDCIVLTRDDVNGEYNLELKFLPWTIT